MDYIRKLGLAEGEDLGDGVVGEVKLADDTPDAGLNHSNDKDEAKAAGSKSSVDEDYKAISRKAGNPPVINTRKGRSSQTVSTECGRASPEIREMKHTYVI